MSWEDIPLMLHTNTRGGGGMSKNEFSIVWHKTKNSVSLTLNRFLNEAIEKGEYYYFGMKRETESGLIVILLQKKKTPSNVRLYVASKVCHGKKRSYNYKITARSIIKQVMDALGLEDKEALYRVKISDNKSKNNTCMLFEVEIPAITEETKEAKDIYEELTQE